MNQYLLEILKEMSTIIIPGLGALTITNPKTGEILFMPYLKYDDGKLARHISEKEGMSENDAKNLIAKFVREIESQLNIGESYDMFEFGSFSKKPDGDIEFISWNSLPKSENIEVEKDKDKNEEKKTDAPLKPKVGRPKKIIPKDDKKEIESEDEIKSGAIPFSNTETKTFEPDQEFKPSEIKTDDVIIIEEASVDEYVPEIPVDENEKKPEIYSEEKQWADDLDVPPINAKIERPKKPILEKTTKDKKPGQRKPVYIILIILGVLLAGGAVSITIFYDQLGTVFPFMAKESTEKVEKTTKESKINKNESTEDTGSEDSTVVANDSVDQPNKETESQVPTEIPSNNEMIQTSTGLIDPNKPYHIIGGAFTEKSNADKYLDKLISRGSSSVIIGRFDQLYMVSISSFASMEEAQNALSSSKSISSNAWIFRWP